VSDSNRKVKFYAITKAGMNADRTEWERHATVMGRILAAWSEGGSQ
jgi:hypothetical protein